MNECVMKFAITWTLPSQLVRSNRRISYVNTCHMRRGGLLECEQPTRAYGMSSFVFTRRPLRVLARKSCPETFADLLGFEAEREREVGGWGREREAGREGGRKIGKMCMTL